MKPDDVLWSLIFMLLASILLMGADWLVWVLFAPLIILAIRGSGRGILFAGSIAVLLVGYFAIGWMKLYTTRTMVIGLISWYIFFMFFVLATRRLCGKKTFRWWRAPNIAAQNHDAERGWRGPVFFALIPPTIWFFTAKLASYTTIGSSWTDVAMFQPMMAPLIWIVGAKGISFFVILANSLIAAWLLKRSKKIIIAALGLLIIVGSCYAYSRFSSQGSNTLKVALVQANFPQSWEWRREHAANEILDTYLTLTEEAAKQKPDIIVWPEYAIPDDLFRKDHLLTKIMKTVNDTETHLVFGTLRLLNGNSKIKKIKKIAVILSPGADPKIALQYTAVQPVPFEPWTIAGKTLHTLSVGETRVGILLCYEETIPDISAEFSNQNAELLLAMANNSPFKQSRGIYLSSLQTRLRAAESGKYVARATNTGITQFVNPYGRIIAKAKPFRREILTADVKLLHGSTPYSRYGDWPMAMGITAVWLSLLFFKRKRSV